MNQPRTIGALKETSYRSRSVKDELRENLAARLASGDRLFPGIEGYDDTVIPQVVNALLSRHDLLLLGLRGQAKTRLIRMLPTLLDEWSPTFSEGDIPDDPLAPRINRYRRLVEEHGDDVEIRWLHREERFHEKLATPDVTIADLLGEIDIVRHAEGRRLDDEGVLHYGLIPRTNRGIFAINELPDLSPRIQVGLFNALEERDIQIRGFPVRIPLDVTMAFTANPEDYTNRGRIVTPLKDRIGSVIRTHYPADMRDAIRITAENAWLTRDAQGRTVRVPRFMMEIIETVARTARQSPHVNQLSGVSVRMSIANCELMVSNAERRCIRHRETQVVPRISDLAFLSAGCRGKIELMLADDDKAEDRLIQSIVGEAVQEVFESYADVGEAEAVVEGFAAREMTVEVGDQLPTQQIAEQVRSLAPLGQWAARLCTAMELDQQNPADICAAAEFIMEALFVGNRLSKYVYHGRTVFKR